MRSIASTSSAPVGAERASREELTDRDISRGEYENQDPSRGPAEPGEITAITQDTATGNISTKVSVISYIDNVMRLYSGEPDDILLSVIYSYTVRSAYCENLLL